MAPGRRAARRAHRGRRAAEGLALDLRRAAAVEVAARRQPDARADVGVGAAGVGGARRPRPEHPATCSAGASRSSRRPRRGDRRQAVERLAGARAPGSSSPRTRRRASRSCSTRPAIPRRVVHAPEAPPPGAVALVERSLNGGFEGGPDGLVFVTDRELFGTVRVRRPKATPSGRARATSSSG